MKNKMSKPHVVIVGAAGGIGYALTNKILSDYKLTLIVRNKDKFSKINKKEINIIEFDVLQFDSIAKILENAVEINGKISSLIYCVGVQLVKPLRNFTITEIQNIINTNLTSAIIFAKEMSSNRLSNANSIFCAISSTAAKKPEPAIIPYSISKAALETMIKGLSLEIPQKKFIGVAPGWLDTKMTRSFAHVYDSDFKKNLSEKSTKGIATVDSVADLIISLIKEESKCSNGEIVSMEEGEKT